VGAALTVAGVAAAVTLTAVGAVVAVATAGSEALAVARTVLVAVEVAVRAVETTVVGVADAPEQAVSMANSAAMRKNVVSFFIGCELL